MPRAKTGPSADRRRLLRRLAQGGAAAGAAAAILAAAPSGAGDRTLTGRLSQTFLGDTNLQVDRNNTGGGSNEREAALGSRSRLSIDYTDSTPSSLLRFGGDIDYDLYTGSDNDNISGLFPDLQTSYRVAGRRSSLQISAFGSAQPVDTFDVASFPFFDPSAEPTPIDPTDPNPSPFPGTPNGTASSQESIRTIYGARLSLTEQINSRDTTSVSLSVQRRDFIDGTRAQTPTNQLSTSTSWGRQVNSRTGVGIAVNASVLKAEGATDRETYTFSVTPNVSYAATPDRTFNLSLGPQYSVSERKEPTLFGTSPPDVSYTLGLRASAGMRYSYDNVEAAFSLTQNVAPNDDGDAVNRTTINASLTQRISGSTSLATVIGANFETPLGGDSTSSANETANLRYTGTLRHQVNRFDTVDAKLGATYRDDGQGRDVVLSTGAGYSHRLTEDTSLRLGYNFRMPMGDIDDEDNSHRVSLTLTRDFTLLP